MSETGTRIRDVVQRIQGEFNELPDLRLTRSQVQRIWHLDRALCEALLAAFVDARFLSRAPDGSFFRRRADVVMSLDRLDRIIEFDAANLCVTVEAGMKLAALQTTLAQKREILPLDPPADSKVTVGGLVAANLSGPSRLLYGTARDWVLGMRVALPGGERIHCGGKVIKNVSGYDMNKLFIGSLGTLGIITEVTFKLLPLPAMRAGVVGLFPDLAQATGVVGKTLESVLLPEALDLLDPEAVALLAPRLGLEAPVRAHGLAVALAGSRETVERQVRDFSALFRDAGGRATPLPDGRTVLAWDAIRNVFRFLPVPPAVQVLCKIAVPISRTGELFASAGTLGRRHGLHVAVTAHAGSGIVGGAGRSGRSLTSRPAEISVTPFSRRNAFTFFHSKVLLACVRLITRPAPCEAEFRDSGLPLPLTTKPGEAIEPGMIPNTP